MSRPKEAGKKSLWKLRRRCGGAGPPPPVVGAPAGVEAAPTDPGPPTDALVEASGSVVVSLDGRERRLELTDCTIGHDLGGYLRGSGPDGRVLLRTAAPGWESCS